MSTDRDTTRLVRSWLAEGVTTLPDRVLEAVLDEVPATPQRRPMWPPRRFGPTSISVRVVMAAAALVLVAALVELVPGLQIGPSASPSGLSATPTAPSTPGPIATAVPTAREALPAGSYHVDGPDTVPFTMSIGAGWERDSHGFLRAAGGHDIGFGTWVVDRVYGDACHWNGTLLPTPDVASLEAMLGGQTGHDGGGLGPVGLTLAGLPTRRLDYTLEPGADVSGCDDGIARLWPDPGTGVEAGGWAIYPGQRVVLWVIEAGGRTGVAVLVALHGGRDSGTAGLDLESLRFDP
jgi:hypothetical protein